MNSLYTAGAEIRLSTHNDPMRIARAEIVLEEFTTPPGLVVSRIEISGAGLVPHRHGLEAEGPVAFRATVQEIALAEFLDKEKPGGMTNFAVRIRPEAISLRATKRIILAVPLAVECLVEILDRRRLNIRLLEASAFGAGVTTLAENEIAKANPVFDAADLPVRVEFDRVELSDGSFTLFGEAFGPFGSLGHEPSILELDQ